MRSPWSGQARIALDGTAAATVDLRATSTTFRQAVWTRNGLTPGLHSLQVTVLGTTGRPTVVTDGIVVLS